MNELLQWDIALFEAINSGLQNSFLDTVLPLWRNKYIWIPAYLFLISFLLINFQKKGLLIILVAVLTIAIADMTSSRILKKSIQRLRPCKTAQIVDQVHLLVPCGSGYSFPSSHATNHFALALFLIGVAGTRFSKIKLPLLLWAASIAISQVYVGVHFPLDILGGTLLGCLIGFTMSRVLNIAFLNKYPLVAPD
ncbi:MAG: membrane-associated phospholipid phosphatase [Polaribacter sp.]|jgi:membrane-associated phospholipid phosphatase